VSESGTPAFRQAGEEDLLADSWIKVADEGAVPDGGTLPVYPRGLGLLLVKAGESIYAVANRCAHMACPLEAGAYDSFVITCPCHDWRFDVRTGAFVEAPEISIPTYRVRVADGEVFVEL
jgi:3-phenylpropionate/trans-cinnamate dioxygenase ferredoxin subunit